MKRFVILFETRQSCTVSAARFEIDGGARFFDDAGRMIAAAPERGLLAVVDETHMEELVDLDDFGELLNDVDVEGWEN